MKVAVRALVLGMLITGFAADQMLATKAAPTSTPTTVTIASAAPMPPCNPGTACGMNRF